MKTKTLSLLFFFQLVFSFGQSMQINQITPTAVNGGINVNLLVTTFNGAGYLSHSYSIVNNTIDLSVCYWFDLTLAVYQINNDFFIEVPNNTNYVINVGVVNSSSQSVCNNFSTGPTATTNYLEKNVFETLKENYTIYPNPANGIIEFKGLDEPVKLIQIFDNLGRTIKEFKDFRFKAINLNDLNDGSYIIKIQTENGSLNQKLILKK
jgi:hypothetical protein